MVAVESLILLCIIDYMEGRDVATIYITGRFIKENTDEIVNMKIQGRMDEVLVKVDF